ncbi:carboxymethylcellulase B [Aspergillus luchuensis]|uniref:cellulase n=1 Tax=Aspergillus kawachii TaxID=1069201 RepID=A0A146F345_ASPKA|nr:carboxymethylcellulase B [Aspergillus luchuensis]
MDPRIGTTTNGPNWIGYLTTTENASLVLNYNFAAGGATIDNALVPAYPGDLASQFRLFEDVYAQKPETAPWDAKDAVFGVWIGINDIGNAYYSTDAATYTPKLISRLESLVEEVYKNGGRKFLFLNVPPTSRSPLFLDQGEEVVKQHAEYLAVFNENLEGMVEKFNKEKGDGTDYIFPDPSAISTLIDKGMNFFRVQFMMERLLPDSMTGSYDEDNGEIISSTSDFQTFWENLAGQYKDNDLVMFDTNNEYHDMDQDLVLNLNQAAINGIRAAGATSQYIFVEGNSWTGAWTWVDVNDNMKNLTDPEDKIVYEMHQYLDSDGSGTSETCVSETIGKERVTEATQWLKDNKKVGFIGEYAGGSNDVCRSAVSGMLEYMANNTDVWKGASWWAAGPWWGDYIFSMEPPDGTAYTGMLDILEAYL